ncbi:hypothetical protein [Neolewinella litorea]|uniref:SCP domain-containing protein n=1 Tax=Neolewinella litorea TaxID=2562452 RepID=A0A4S4NHY6_9BACT|nr:hypothetical protein [Neolewinella litorea]THH37818.1 hypothetical protein E4021_12315 [Neolewinella litorea]
MRYLTLLLMLSSLLACADANSQQPSPPPGDADVEQLLAASMRQVEPTKYNEVLDRKSGMVQARFPIPQSWRVNHPEAPIFAEGPDGLRIHRQESQQYAWSSDPMMQQTIRMQGTYQLMQPQTLQQILENYVRPNAANQGYSFVGEAPAPEVAGFWQRLYNAMPNTGSRRSVDARVTEWDTPNGKSLILLVLTQTTNGQLLIWNLMSTEMESAANAYNRHRNAYLYSYANGQLNPAWIRHMNGELASQLRENDRQFAEESARSASAHRQRMQAIAARGTAASAAGQTYSDILDISHQGFLSRSNINDAGHARTIDAISGTALIGNHETGEHYSVPAGANYYWVSSQGTYFGTDNALFNPNTDQRTNDTEWTKFAVER